MKLGTLILLSLLSLSAYSKESPLKPFVTDGCTGYSEGTRQQPNLWAHCCITHDLSMWAGGSRSERNQADRDLRSCIRQTGHPNTAFIIYMGVRLGSLSPIKLADKAWNNGWKIKREKVPLTAYEVSLIEEHLKENPPNVDPAIIASFLKGLKERVGSVSDQICEPGEANIPLEHEELIQSLGVN